MRRGPLAALSERLRVRHVEVDLEIDSDGIDEFILGTKRLVLGLRVPQQAFVFQQVDRRRCHDLGSMGEALVRRGRRQNSEFSCDRQVKVSVRRSVPSRATCEGRHPETFTMAVELLRDRPIKNGMPRREGLTE